MRFRDLFFKFLRAQILSIFAAVVAVAAFVAISANVFKVVMSVFTFVTLIALTWRNAWETGSSDFNRVKIGQLRKYAPLKGFYACGLLGGIWIIVSLINIFIRSNVLNLIVVAFNLPAIGFYLVYGYNSYINVFIITLIGNFIWIMSATFGYVLGYKRVSFGSKLVYKRTKK